jgi:hypothetical protein
VPLGLTSREQYGKGIQRAHERLNMNLFAYIDPGSGSLVLQAILAALVSVPFFFRRTIGGAIGKLRGRSKPESSKAEESGQTEPPSQPDGVDSADH